MKVIVLTDHFAQGGAERVASLITNRLSSIDGNEVHVCVFEDTNNYNVLKERILFHVLADSKKGYLVNAWLKIYNLSKIMKRVKADVIFSFGPIMNGYVYFAKKLSGIKKLYVVASERNDPRKEPVEEWKKKVRNFCYNHADVLVCQTQMAVDLLREQYGVKTKMVIISNPITPNLPVWKGVDSKNIIAACRLTEQKNIPMMIDAFEKLHKEHPDYRLIIYGEGELRQYLINIISQKKLQGIVLLPGFTNAIHEAMQNAYMYVSSSNYEGISNSMLESMGIGLPVVCTDCPVGGAGMYVKDGKNGLLTPVGDTESFYLAMKRFIEDKQLAQTCSENSKAINRELAVDKIVDKWLELTAFCPTIE